MKTYLSNMATVWRRRLAMDFLTFLSFKFAKFVSFSGVSGLTAVTVELAGSRYAGVLTFAPGVKWTVFSDDVL